MVRPTGTAFSRKEKRRSGQLLHCNAAQQRHQKVGEEAVETALAAVSQDKPETLSEVADLVYHLTLLLHHQELAWEDVIAKLQERHQGIGLHLEGSNK